MRKFSRDRLNNLNTGASTGAARRDVSDPMTSIVDCGLGSNRCIVLFSVIENSNTLNR